MDLEKPKKIRYICDKQYRPGVYVRAWNEGRGRNKETIVQVWKSATPEGEPQGDWAMPAFLGPIACIEQAILQTD